MNDKGITVSTFEKAMNLIKRGTDLNMREVNGNKIVLENNEFVIEIKHKRRAGND